MRASARGAWIDARGDDIRPMGTLSDNRSGRKDWAPMERHGRRESADQRENGRCNAPRPARGARLQSAPLASDGGESIGVAAAVVGSQCAALVGDVLGATSRDAAPASASGRARLFREYQRNGALRACDHRHTQDAEGQLRRADADDTKAATCMVGSWAHPLSLDEIMDRVTLTDSAVDWSAKWTGSRRLTASTRCHRSCARGGWGCVHRSVEDAQVGGVESLTDAQPSLRVWREGCTWVRRQRERLMREGPVASAGVRRATPTVGGGLSSSRAEIP